MLPKADPEKIFICFESIQNQLSEKFVTTYSFILELIGFNFEFQTPLTIIKKFIERNWLKFKTTYDLDHQPKIKAAMKLVWQKLSAQS